MTKIRKSNNISLYFAVLNLILLLTVYIIYPDSSIYGYIILLFGFFTITSNLYQLLEVRFDKIIADRKLENAQRFLEVCI